jgi:hypothetical protein
MTGKRKTEFLPFHLVPDFGSLKQHAVAGMSRSCDRVLFFVPRDAVILFAECDSCPCGKRRVPYALFDRDRRAAVIIGWVFLLL